jgi:hypothetical protein
VCHNREWIIHQLWLPSENLAAENGHHPIQNCPKTHLCRLLQCSEKDGDVFCQTQLLAIKPGFIIMTHNEKTINGMVSLVITTQETIQGADFYT